MTVDLDAPRVDLSTEAQEEQRRMDEMAALASYYYLTLRQYERLPDELVHGLVTGWQAAWLERE